MPTHLVLAGREDSLDLFGPDVTDLDESADLSPLPYPDESVDLVDVDFREPDVTTSAGGAVTVHTGWLDRWREWHGWDRTANGNVFLRDRE